MEKISTKLPVQSESYPRYRLCYLLCCTWRNFILLIKS